MATTLPSEGWSFEGPDPEVGIFGTSVVHEACPGVPYDDDVPSAEQIDVSYRTDRSAGTVTEATTFMCPVCESTTTVTDVWPADDFEEPGRGGGH